jgi:hypothetical protein
MEHRAIKDSLLEDKSDFHRVDIKSMFFGAKHYAFVYEDYKDIRLVGNPPEDIGKFGGDTDNWMWPRHTGDFSLLRIYANEENEPAEYSEDNVPYEPKRNLKVSLEGVRKGDYTMIMGYPGRTNRYLTSYDIEQRYKITNPARIELRDTRLDIWKSYMDKSKKIRLQYASKYAQISNYYKYFKGQNRGFRRKNTVEKRKKFEDKFVDWVQEKEERKEKYGGLLEDFEKIYEDVKPYRKPVTYFGECLLAPELFSFMYQHSSFLSKLKGYNVKKADDDKKEEMKKAIAEFKKKELDKLFKDYQPKVDEEVTAAMLKKYYNDLEPRFRPKYFETLVEEEYEKDFEKLAADMFAETPFRSREAMKEFLEKPGFLQKPRGKKLKQDMAYKLFSEMYNHLLSAVRTPFSTFRTEKTKLSRKWVKGLKAMYPDSSFYPNANSTMRLTYGKVKGLQPRDAVEYRYYTTLAGVIQKHNPNDKEFHVPDKLIRLYDNKDFGRYARNDGQMPVCFVHKTDITGGNSGSPVMNQRGELIGLAFDGNWESMTSDIVVQPSVTRTISVDIRYVLFIIDKFARADRIMNELDIVDKSRASRDR